MSKTRVFAHLPLDPVSRPVLGSLQRLAGLLKGPAALMVGMAAAKRIALAVWPISKN